MPVSNVYLLDGLAVLLSNPQMFDADPAAVVGAFPYIGKTAEGNWVITDSG